MDMPLLSNARPALSERDRLSLLRSLTLIQMTLISPPPLPPNALPLIISEQVRDDFLSLCGTLLLELSHTVATVTNAVLKGRLDTTTTPTRKPPNVWSEPGS